MNSGKNFRARRRLEIEAENARQKALTENLEVLKAVKSKELRAIKKLQANIRGYLCRLYVVPKSFQFIFGQMVSFFKREIHIYVELSLDIKRKPP